MGKEKPFDSLVLLTGLLDAYAAFLQEVVNIEEESGAEVLQESMARLPKTIEEVTKKNLKLGNKLAIWTIKVVNVSNAMSKIQTLKLEQKKALVNDLKSVSAELLEIKTELEKL